MRQIIWTLFQTFCIQFCHKCDTVLCI